MATFGIDGRRSQAIAWALLIACELGLAAGVIAGSATAAYLAAALMATFAATMVGAILRGRAGAPCACFGARSTVGWGAVARNARARRRLRRAARAADRASCPPTSGSGSGSRSRCSPAPGSPSPCSRSPARSGCCACGSGPERARDRRGGPAAVRASELIDRFEPAPEATPRAWRRSSPPAVTSATRSSPRSARSPTTPGGGRDLRRGRGRRRLGRAGDPGEPVRDRARPRGRRCWRRGRSTTSPSSRACSRPPSAAAPSASSPEPSVSEPRPDRFGRALDSLAGGHLAARLPRPHRRRAHRAHRRQPGGEGGQARARPTPSTSAATSTPPAPASTRPGCRGSTATAIRCDAEDGVPVDDLGRKVNSKGQPVDTHGKALRDPDGRPLPPAPADQGLRRDRAASTASTPTSTAAGTAAAAAPCASSSTAARTRRRGSTATRRSRATATAGARSSASCTSRPRSRVERARAHARARLALRRAGRRPAAPGRRAASR